MLTILSLRISTLRRTLINIASVRARENNKFSKRKI